MGQDPQQLILVCPCGQKMKVPVEAIGKEASCVKCGQKIPITEQTTQASTNGATPKNSSFNVNDDGAVQQLLADGKITPENIEQAVLINTEIDEPLWSILIRLGCFSSSDFHGIMVKREGIASIDLAHYNIPSTVLDILPGNLIRKHKVIPIDKLGKLLTLSMANPLDSQATRAVEEHTGLRVKTMLSPQEDIARSIRKYYPDKRSYLSSDLTSKSLETAEAFYYEHPECPLTQTLFSMTHLPINPSTVEGIQHALHDTLNPLDEIMNVVSNDPGAVLHILRIANAEAYGFAGDVDGLGVAITLLGPEAILAHLKECRQRSDNVFCNEWDSFSRTCGDACAAIAEAANVSSPASMKTLGLLGGIGEMILAECLPNCYGQVMNGLDTEERIEKSEMIFGVNPQSASTYLTAFWNLPTSMTDPIKHSASFTQSTEFKDRAAVLSLGIHMAETFAAKKELRKRGEIGATEHLKLEWSDVKNIYNTLLENSPAKQMA